VPLKKQTVLDGRYELGKPLGQGGMATVRMAADLRLGRTVAVKLLRTDRLADPTFLERFRREARAAGSLNHASIVAVYDTGEAADGGDGLPAPYIVMEYVEGRTIRALLRAQKRIDPERALEITAEVLAALEHSHQAGIVHRDIKPGNVMVTPSGAVKVMDFGIARALDAGQTITKTSAMIGTAQYISPEQVRGGAIDIRSDLYSTGCLLYEMLTGRPPFTGDSPIAVAYQHVREMPAAASSLNRDVPPEADAILQKALQKNPRVRYQTAFEMRADVLRALDGVGIAAGAGPSAVPTADAGPSGAADASVNSRAAALVVPVRPAQEPVAGAGAGTGADSAADSAAAAGPGTGEAEDPDRTVAGIAAMADDVHDPGLPGERTIVEADEWGDDGGRTRPASVFEPEDDGERPMSRRRKLVLAAVAVAALLVIGGGGTMLAILLGAGGPGPNAERPIKPAVTTNQNQNSPTTSKSPSPTQSEDDDTRVVRDDEPQRRNTPTPTPTETPTPTTSPSPTKQPTPTPTKPEPTEPEPEPTQPTNTPRETPTTTPAETPDPDAADAAA
jgi:tRNA A-37 threonylcarbamoyl transferase component Bud32